MPNYKLSNQAELDLIRIAEFGFETFGIELALNYKNNLELHFENIYKNPFAYVSVDHIRPGVRRSAFKSHAIYYIPRKTDIYIIRVLGSQDPSLALERE